MRSRTEAPADHATTHAGTQGGATLSTEFRAQSHRFSDTILHSSKVRIKRHRQRYNYMSWV